jgi:hypothetical protein
MFQPVEVKANSVFEQSSFQAEEEGSIPSTRPRHRALRLARPLARNGELGSRCIVSLSHVIRHHRAPFAQRPWRALRGVASGLVFHLSVQFAA